jgi:hypothetical protein
MGVSIHIPTFTVFSVRKHKNGSAVLVSHEIIKVPHLTSGMEYVPSL